jgi:ABC-2 type transport system permease protein
MSRAPGGAVVWMRRLLVMVSKDLLQLRRDRVLLAFLVYAFTADIYLAGSGARLDFRHAATVVWDGDRSRASRELLGRFQEPHFHLLGSVDYRDAGVRRLDRGDAMIAIVVPPGFQRDLLAHRTAEVQIQVDATNSVLGFLAEDYASQIVGGYGNELAIRRAARAGTRPEDLPLVVDDHRVWFNPNQRDDWFVSVTELLNIITLFAILLPAAATAREKERGTILQLMVSPLSPFQILFPKVLAMTAVILAGTAVCLAAILIPLFHLPVRGSLLLFFAVTALYVFTTAGIGLLAASIARNFAQVGMLTAMLYAPMIFLSGAWTPPEAMPRAVRVLSQLSPLHYYIEVSFGILLKGNGLALIWDSVLGMAVLGTILFGLCIALYRHRLG